MEELLYNMEGDNIILSKISSYEYYVNDVLRNKLNEYAKKENKKITLDLSRDLNIDLMSQIGWEYTLFKSDNIKITDVSMLDSVYKLNLSGHDDIVDISNLGKIHTLNISYCTKITDVSCLRNVYSLNLCNCEKITDVSMLSSISLLYLENCPNIMDVGMLINLKILSVNKYIYGIQFLRELKILYVKCTNNKMSKNYWNEAKKLKKINKTVNINYIENGEY